jgi:hypothetical protein
MIMLIALAQYFVDWLEIASPVKNLLAKVVLCIALVGWSKPRP